MTTGPATSNLQPAGQTHIGQTSPPETRSFQLKPCLTYKVFFLNIVALWNQKVSERKYIGRDLVGLIPPEQ